MTLAPIYRVASDTDYHALCAKVSARLAQGWQSVGGMIAVPTGRKNEHVYMQAMAKTMAGDAERTEPW